MPPTQPGKQPAKLTPFPAGWHKYTAGQKREWMAKNRPGGPEAPQPAAPARQPAYPPITPPESDQSDEYGEQTGEETTLEPTLNEQCNDEVQITVKLPGQDSTTVSGRAFIANLLRSIADSLSES